MAQQLYFQSQRYLEFWNKLVTEAEERVKDAVFELKNKMDEELEEFVNFRKDAIKAN